MDFLVIIGAARFEEASTDRIPTVLSSAAGEAEGELSALLFDNAERSFVPTFRVESKSSYGGPVLRVNHHGGVAGNS